MKRILLPVGIIGTTAAAFFAFSPANAATHTPGSCTTKDYPTKTITVKAHITKAYKRVYADGHVVDVAAHTIKAHTYIRQARTVTICYK